MTNQIHVSVEITGSLGRRVAVSVPAERLEQAVKERITRIAKTAKIDGFRPGKVPVKTAEKLFGQAARGEAAEALLQSSLQQALVQEKLQPAAYPVIESFKADAGGPLQYTASFEVFPEVQVSGLKQVTLEKLVVDITDADVEQVLQQMRKQHSQWEAVNQPAAMGDRITFNMVTGPDKKEQKDLQLVLEEGGMPAEFAVLKGKKVGEQVTLQWQGSETTINLSKIEVAKLPEINDEFAKRLSVSDGTVIGLYTEVRKHMQDELERVLKDKLKTQVIDKLVERNPVELPKSAVDAEYERLAQDFRNRVKKELGQEIQDLPEAVQQSTKDAAHRRVTLSVLFPAIIKQHDIKLDDTRVRTHIQKILASFENADNMIDMVLKDKNVMSSIRSQVLEEQVIEKLLEQVSYTDKNANYNEVMKFAHTNHYRAEDYHEHEHVHDENCQHDH